MKCPSCNSHMNYSMKYDYYYNKPIIIYTCENCNYITFGEAYITNGKSTITPSCNMTTSNTETKYETKNSVRKNSNSTIYKKL